MKLLLNIVCDHINTDLNLCTFLKTSCQKKKNTRLKVYTTEERVPFTKREIYFPVTDYAAREAVHS
jgi:hypothetical protein